MILIGARTLGSRKRQPRHRAVKNNRYPVYSIENVDLRGEQLNQRSESEFGLRLDVLAKAPRDLGRRPTRGIFEIALELRNKILSTHSA